MLSPSILADHPSTTEFYHLSLHDALPILIHRWYREWVRSYPPASVAGPITSNQSDKRQTENNSYYEISQGFTLYPLYRSSLQLRQHHRYKPSGGRVLTEIGRGTRLNSSHVAISYAVFCL